MKKKVDSTVWDTCQVILYMQHIFRVCLVHMHLGENMQKAITPSDFKHYINNIVSTHWWGGFPLENLGMKPVRYRWYIILLLKVMYFACEAEIIVQLLKVQLLIRLVEQANLLTTQLNRVHPAITPNLKVFAMGSVQTTMMQLRRQLMTKNVP